MARKNGRDLRFVDGSDNVLGVATTKNFAINHTPVNVEGDDDAGYATVLSRAGLSQITMEISFVFDDSLTADLLDVAAQGTLFADYDIEFLDNGDLASPTVVYDISCSFFLTNVSITGASEGRIEGTASFVSSGAWTVTTA